ncbi:hypothetical protein FLAV_01185 [Flavobacteriales bacterium]|nr:hypothetical protein FLAV_01185 [Flavobacteriales bacterium]
MSFTKEDYFRLFPSCIAVKGYSRSLIIDTDERKLFYIGNSHYNLIQELETNSVLEIISIKSNDEGFIFLNYLLRNNLGQIIKKENLDNFLPIDSNINIPFTSNSIIDVDNYNFSLLKLSIEKLSLAKISNIQFRFLNDISFSQLKKIIQLIESFSFYTVEFLFSSTLYSMMSKENISYLENNQLITKIFVFNSNYERIQRNSKFLFLSKVLNDYNLCGHTSVKYFSSFLETVINSKKYNSCLNCKISIDKEGQVKNCPSMKESYGNIKDVSLIDVLNMTSFQKFNKITKDNINVCLDCEYRYVCSDCRAYTDNPTDIYSRPSKCNYNPYICKWKNEEGYKTLEECGVISNKDAFSIDFDKIVSINKLLWEEETENA